MRLKIEDSGVFYIVPHLESVLFFVLRRNPSLFWLRNARGMR